MRYQLIGVNHNSAPLEVREQLAIPESRLPYICRELTAYPGIEEGMVISNTIAWRSSPTRPTGTPIFADFCTATFTSLPGTRLASVRIPR